MIPHKSSWLLVIFMLASFGNADGLGSHEQENELNIRKSEETSFLRVRSQDGFLTMLEEGSEFEL